MDVTFIYQNKQITTPNLEKKLKRMGITKDDIKIIDTPKPKEEDNSLVYPLSWYRCYKYPDKELWLVRITEYPEDTILFNNQILKLDKNKTIL